MVSVETIVKDFLLERGEQPVSIKREGDLYKILEVEGTTFHILYGYYSDSERSRWEPAPIYPNFLRDPRFTHRGEPYARADQDVCRHYDPKPTVSGENWCNDCRHFQSGADIIGICKARARQENLRQNE